jgi:hypothetical protein
MWSTKGLPTYGLGALPVVESINQSINTSKKSKDFPAHVIKAQRGIRDIAPLVSNLGPKWR